MNLQGPPGLPGPPGPPGPAGPPGGGSDLSGALILAPAASPRNVVQPTGDVDIVTLKRNAAGSNNSLLRLQQADGTDLFKFDDNRLRIYKGAGVSPSIQLVSNPTTNSVVGWEMGIDVGAPVADRDFYIAKMLPGGGVRDFLYCNHNGGSAEPTINIGRSPGDSTYRVTVATDQATAAMGGLCVYQSSSNTGMALAVRDWSDVIHFSAHTDGTVNLLGGAAKLSITGLSTTTTVAIATRASGDTGDRLNVAAGGLLSWLPGDGTAADVSLGRGAVNRLDLKLGELRGFGAATTNPVFVTAVSGDGNRRWQVRANGDQLWGDGTASPDFLAGRVAANRLHIGQNAANEVIVGGSTGKVGFYATAPVAKAAVTGSRGANAALASLLTALAATGLITDSSTA